MGVVSDGGVKNAAVIFTAGAIAGGVGGCVFGYSCHEVVKAREQRKARKRAERKEMLEKATECLGASAVLVALVLGLLGSLSKPRS